MKNTIILCLVMMVTTLSFGQSKRVKIEDIKAQKKAFILKELNLTDEKTIVFWPVYENYDQEIHELRRKRRKIHKALKNYELLSETEIYKLTKEFLVLEKKEATIRITYLDRFTSVVGKGKAALVYHAEQKFKKELFRKMKDGDMPPPPHHH